MKHMRWLFLIPLMAACDSPTEPEVWTFEGDIAAASITLSADIGDTATVECQIADPGGEFIAIPVLGITPATGPVCRHYRVESSPPVGPVVVTYPLYIAGAPIGGRYRVRVE
jgi:hypothetical protein